MLQRIAHRGGSWLAPENTMAAFRNALTLQADGIECDVQMSRDGQAVVFHDAMVERITDGTGNILDLDAAYLHSLNAAAHFLGGWPQPEQIPTLHDVLDFARNRLRVYIEIKQSDRNGVYGSYPHIAESVVAEVLAQKMLNQVLVMSFDWSALPLIKKLEPGLQTSALVDQKIWHGRAANNPQTLVELVKRLGVSWLGVDYRLVTEEMVRVVHEHELKIGLWTVNVLEDMRHFSAMGVDSLTSDRPDLFAELTTP